MWHWITGVENVGVVNVATESMCRKRENCGCLV